VLSKAYLSNAHRLIQRNRKGVVLRDTKTQGVYMIKWEGIKTPSPYHMDFLELVQSEESLMIVDAVEFSFVTRVNPETITQYDVAWMENYYRNLREYRDSLYAEPMNKKKKMDYVEAITAELARVLDWIIDFKIENKIA
jgi:hypothetical protein